MVLFFKIFRYDASLTEYDVINRKSEQDSLSRHTTGNGNIFTVLKWYATVDVAAGAHRKPESTLSFDTTAMVFYSYPCSIHIGPVIRLVEKLLKVLR